MFLTSPSKKSPYYQITYEVNGKRTTVSTRTKDKKKAEAFLRNFVPSVQKTRLERNEEIKIDFTLSAFKNEYINYKKSTSSISYIERSIEPAFKKFQEVLGNIKLNSVTVREIDKFLSVTSAKSKSAAALYYRTLKAAFSKSESWGYIDSNPFRKLKSPKVVKKYPVFISQSEFESILKNTKNDFLKNIFITGFYTGMRLSEILNMRWDWIDFNQLTITIKNSETFTTKSGKERIIPINQRLHSTLKSIIPKIVSLNKSGLVFYKIDGIRLNNNFVSKQFKKAVREADLNDDIHFHSLRHSFASLLVQKGVSLYVVKELLGHQDLATTQIYSHLQAENLSQAVNML